jgi:hypothetical protein
VSGSDPGESTLEWLRTVAARAAMQGVTEEDCHAEVRAMFAIVRSGQRAMQDRQVDGDGPSVLERPTASGT